MKTTVSSKGQIVIPAELRELDRIRPGQQFAIERIEPGEYRLRRLNLPAGEGLVRWLAECPARDWFQPVPSESTENL